jgi:3',5'-cyclic AMP phosphodiesterase CpdA
MPTTGDFTIAHLSDLHLGNDFVFRSLKRGRWWWKTEDKILLERLAEALRSAKPDFVILSGDIVNKSTPDTFAHAAGVLRKLCLDAGVDLKTQVFLIPGNHDVLVFPEEHKHFRRLELFVEFLKELFGEDDIRTRTERFAFLDPYKKVALFGLDSTLKHDSTRIEGQPIAEGKIGLSQLSWLERKHTAFCGMFPDYLNWVKVVAVHHHPHPIADAGADRFMQLLDAGETTRVFERIGANIVLHGHKHFPHTLEHQYLGNHHYTVIGAGTACCPIVSEQAGAGNSFNLIYIRPAANKLDVDRYRANNHKKFDATKIPEFPRPLFRRSEKGYRFRERRLEMELENDDGDCMIADLRLGLTADSIAGNNVKQIAFGWTFSNAAAFTNFDVDTREVAHTQYDAGGAHERNGVFALKEPLSWGGNPRDLSCTMHVKSGLQTRRTPENDIESFDLDMKHPADLVTIMVDFPRSYSVTPEARLWDSNRHTVSPELVPRDLVHEKWRNRYTLTVYAPRLGDLYGIVWKLP